jgi:mRNA-degrading endonuclease RelE of RelBE toxin-antitoxin system
LFAAIDYPIQIAELGPFRKEALGIWTEEEMKDLRDYLALNPQSGDVVPGTGGIRKLRWRTPDRGKRGGARVIYYFRDLNMPLYLISVYKKSERDTLAQAERNDLRKLVEDLVDAHSKVWLRVVKDQLA